MFSRQEINQANQTEFVDQSQFLEKQSSGAFSLKNLKKNKNLLPFYILIGLFFIIFLLMILKVVFKEKTVQTETKEETKNSIQLNPLSLRVNELKENLKSNNPTKENLPFPQVDLEFNIN